MKTIKINGAFAGLTCLFLFSLAGGIYFDLYWLAAVPFLMLILAAGWLDPRLVFFALIFSLPFSTELFFANGLSTDFPDEGLMWILSFLILVSAISKPITRESRNHPIFWLLLVWLGWIAVTVVLSTDPLLSLKYFAAKLWYVAAFFLPFLLWPAEKFSKKAIIILVASIIPTTAFVLFRHSAEGFSFASINDVVRPFFRNHVNYSAMLACVLPFCIFLYMISNSRRWKIALFFISAIILFAIVFAYARGAWLALVTGVLAFFLVRARLVVAAFLFSIAAFIGILLWMQKDQRYLSFAPHYKTTIFHEDFRQHLAATYQLKDISTAERINRWVAGVNMVGERPITGFGPNNFYEHYKSFSLPAFKTWVSDNPERSGVHNYFLLLAIEQGLPGLLFFLLLAGAMLYYSQSVYRKSKNKFDRNLALAAGVVTVQIITLNLLSDLIETDKIGALFFLCLGFLVRSDPRTYMKRVP